MEAAIQTRLVCVRGRVQGVGYRYACVLRARELGVVGWVRNRADGSVEAMLQGAPQVLARMCDWMERGVRGAWVERMEVSEVKAPSPPLEGFEQLPTA